MYKTVAGRWGPCTFIGRDEYIGRSIYNYGEYNPDETEMLISLAKDRCLDIGANIGCISQALLRAGFRVDAFEPQPEMYAMLVENTSAGKDRVSTYCTAVGSTGGMALMPKVQYSKKGNFGGLAIGDKSIYGSIEVPVITIDEFNYDDVGLMKIDVEGYEREVLILSLIHISEPTRPY